jgi:hypothetical protein
LRPEFLFIFFFFLHIPSFHQHFLLLASSSVVSFAVNCFLVGVLEGELLLRFEKDFFY